MHFNSQSLVLCMQQNCRMVIYADNLYPPGNTADAYVFGTPIFNVCSSVSEEPTASRGTYIGSSRKCTTPLSLPTTRVSGAGVPAKLQQVSPVSAMNRPSTEPARKKPAMSAQHPPVSCLTNSFLAKDLHTQRESPPSCSNYATLPLVCTRSFSAACPILCRHALMAAALELIFTLQEGKRLHALT